MAEISLHVVAKCSKLATKAMTRRIEAAVPVHKAKLATGDQVDQIKAAVRIDQRVKIAARSVSSSKLDLLIMHSTHSF